MTTAAELLGECQTRGLILQSRGGRVDIDAPEGELTPELLEALKANKAELLVILGPQETGDAAGFIEPNASGLSNETQAEVMTTTDPAPWMPPPWPPVVPADILADPVPICGDCGRAPVVKGQPGRPEGLCFDCWSIKATTPARRFIARGTAELQAAKRQAAERYKAVAKTILSEAEVEHVRYHDKGLRGRAWAKERRVLVPHPTTRRRLYIVAHEAGHIELAHVHGKVHRQEYEAERYAHEALRKHEVAVPAKSTKRAKEYVAWKIHQAIRRGAQTIDKEALEWCKPYWTKATLQWVQMRGRGKRP